MLMYMFCISDVSVYCCAAKADYALTRGQKIKVA